MLPECGRRPSPDTEIERQALGEPNVAASFPARPAPPPSGAFAWWPPASAADRPPRDDAASSPSASTTAPKPREQTRPRGRVRGRRILTEPHPSGPGAVASGRRAAPNPSGAASRCVPSRSRRGIKLRVVKYDERRAFTSNHPTPPPRIRTLPAVVPAADAAARSRLHPRPPSPASSAVDGGPAARDSPTSWRLRPDRPPAQSHQIRRGAASLAAPANSSPTPAPRVPHPRRSRVARPRQIPTLGPVRSVPEWRRPMTSANPAPAIKASRRDKYKQVEEFVKLVRLAVSDARVGSHMAPATL